LYQIKRYLDAYSASSIRGFPAADLAHVQSLYAKAQLALEQSDSPQNNPSPSDSDSIKIRDLENEWSTRQTKRLKGYLEYLLAAASLARAQWTQFGDEWMALGLILLVLSVVVHAVALRRALRLAHRAQIDAEGDSDEQSYFQELFPFKQMLLGCGVAAAVVAG
jgi:phosphatidylinositol glycan class O